MTYTWLQVRAQLGQLLTDVQVKIHPEEVRVDAYNLAQRALLAHTPLLSGIALEGSGSSFALPEDVINEEPMFLYDDATGQWILERIPRSYSMESESAATFYRDWTGNLNLSVAIDPGYTLFYAAYYPDVPAADNDAAEILIPRWAEEGVLLYASSYILLKAASSEANIRQFNTRIDSGTPEHNPHLDLSAHYLSRADRALARHQPWNRLPPFGTA
jgi:hypothetical protein